VRASKFRDDLYYRLNVIHIEVPPLRERPEDVAPLAEHFLHRFCGLVDKAPPEITDAAMARLTAFNWPGNVRELCNVIERIVERSRGERVDVADLPREIVSPPEGARVLPGGGVPPAAGPADVPWDRMSR
jgi:two-component system response regulator AtoC